MTELQSHDLARELALRYEATRRAEVSRTLRRLQHLTETERQHVEELSRQLVSAILEEPLQKLRHADHHLPATRELFGLD